MAIVGDNDCCLGCDEFSQGVEVKDKTVQGVEYDNVKVLAWSRPNGRRGSSVCSGELVVADVDLCDVVPYEEGSTHGSVRCPTDLAIDGDDNFAGPSSLESALTADAEARCWCCCRVDKSPD